MVYVLIALFVVLPILELFVFVQVAGWIGFLPAVALIVAFSVGGAWLVKYEGLGVLRRAQQQLDQGELPATELVNGLLLLIAGALMVVPGFLTDIAGLLLLLPPTRALVRLVLMRRFEKRLRATLTSPAGAVFGAPFGGGFTTTRVFTGAASYGDGPASDAFGPEPGTRRLRPGGVVDVREAPPTGSGPAPREAAGPAHGAGSADAAGPGSAPSSATDPERPTGRY